MNATANVKEAVRWFRELTVAEDADDDNKALAARSRLQQVMPDLGTPEFAGYMAATQDWLNSLDAPAAPAKKKRRMPRGASINRCNDCGKFVSLEFGEIDDPEPEVTDVGEGTSNDASVGVRAEVRLVLTCGECSTEMADAMLEGETDVDFKHDEGCDSEGRDYEVEVTASNQDERSGKGRFGKHFYGAAIELKVTCDHCEGEAEGTITVEEQASGFESCQ